jgi:hypothetical protein
MSEPLDPGARDDEQLQAWLEGRLTDAEAQAFEARLFDDPTIAQRHEVAALLGEALVREASGEAPPGVRSGAAIDGPGRVIGTAPRDPFAGHARRSGWTVPAPVALAASLVLATSLGLNAILLGRGASDAPPSLRGAEVVQLLTLRGGDGIDAVIEADPAAGPLVLQLEPGTAPIGAQVSVQLADEGGRALALPNAVVGGNAFVDVVVDRSALGSGVWRIELRYDDGEVVRYAVELR